MKSERLRALWELKVMNFHLSKFQEGDMVVLLYVSNGHKIRRGSLTEHNIKSVRPSFGLHPKYYHEVIGKTVNKDLKKGDRLSLDLIN